MGPRHRGPPAADQFFSGGLLAAAFSVEPPEVALNVTSPLVPLHSDYDSLSEGSG